MTCRLYSVFLLLASCAAFSSEPSTIITNATLLSPERSAPLSNAWVRIDQGLLTQIGTRHQVAASSVDYRITGGVDGPGPDLGEQPLVDTHPGI